MSKLAVIYARFSSDKQREESIEGQIRECTAFADANDIKIVGTYIDRAMSARTDKRTDFLRMIKDSAKGIFEYVIVYQLDRFSRSRYDSAIYKNRLKKNGVRVLSAKENIKDDPSGIILESVLEGYAEYYSAELSQKVIRGMTDNLLEKKWNGGPVPFGYKTDENGHIVPDSATAGVVRDIYSKFIAGAGKTAISRYLNAQGYKTVAGKEFKRNSLSRILKNKLYTGTLEWAGKEYPNFAPPLINEELFKAAQLLQSNKSRVRSTHPETYALTGKLFCGICGIAMTGHSGTSKSGTLYYYYRCSTKNHKGEKGPRCTAKNIRRDTLEDLVLKTTIQILSSPEALQCIADQAVKVQKKSRESSEAHRLEIIAKDLNKRLQNSIKAVESGIVSQTIANNIATYEKELATIRLKIQEEKLSDAISTPLTANAVKYFLQQLLLKAKKHDKYRLDMFQAFIRRVTVTDNTVEIQYNYHAVPQILKNPVNKTLAGCSSKDVMVDHQGFEPWTP